MFGSRKISSGLNLAIVRPRPPCFRVHLLGPLGAQSSGHRDIQVPSGRSFDRKSFPRSRSGSESVLSARLYFWGNPGIFERLKIETSIFQNVPTVQKAHLASEITSGARFMTGDLLDLFRIGFKATEDQISDASLTKCILAKISGRRALLSSRKVIRCSESD